MAIIPFKNFAFISWSFEINLFYAKNGKLAHIHLHKTTYELKKISSKYKRMNKNI